MAGILDQLEGPAKAMGIPTEELAAIVERGKSVTYESGACLFHESTPREWLGIVVRGEVEVVRGLHGRQIHLATLEKGAVISEGLLLDDGPHASSAFARGSGAVVHAVPRAVLEEVKKAKPEIYFRVAARVARRLGDRLRASSDQLALQENRGAAVVTSYRSEHDSLGDRELPNSAYYGVQTVRALENFAISGVPLRNFGHFVNALAYVKKGAAQANAELKCLDGKIAEAICKACDEILEGKLHEQFVVDMMQGGAGTSTNMNANEVIANRGLELMGHAKGEYQHLHPNDHVNCSQSTNDAYPTAIKLAVIFSLKDTLAAMGELRSALQAKQKEFSKILKMGRTENQDAVPMTLGQEFGAYAGMVDSAMAALSRSVEELHELNMGATAIGTGLNSPPGYADLVTRHLVEITGLPLKKAANLVEATQDSGSFAQMAGTLKRAAVQVSKICNDLRWLSSGPRCGLNEIFLPPMQPGSSIMPGKVNPVIPELVSQICYQIIGYDVTISMASEASELELNMAEPIIAYDLLHGLMIFKNACVTLAARCVSGIKANEARCKEYVQNSIGLVTALNPVIGYEKSASIAKEALATGGSVYELVLQKGWLTKEKLDDLLSPANMTDPRQVSQEMSAMDVPERVRMRQCLSCLVALGLLAALVGGGGEGGAAWADDPATAPAAQEAPEPRPSLAQMFNPDSVDQKLIDASSRPAGILPYGPVSLIDPVWDRLNESLSNIGLRLGLAYTTAFQAASNGPGTRTAAGQDVDFFGDWRLLGQKDDANVGLLYFSTEWRGDMGTGIAPGGLGGQIGSLWGTTNGFSEQPITLKELYWEQRFAVNRVIVRVGKLDPENYYNSNYWQSDNKYFLNAAFSSFPVRAFPGQGLGFNVTAKVTDDWSISTGIQDAQGKKTLAGFDTFFGDFNLFSAAELRYTPTIANLGPGAYRLTAWYRDGGESNGKAHDAGVDLSFDQHIGPHLIPFFRYGAGEGNVNGIKQMISGGIGWEGRLLTDGDAVGLGGSWGQPTNGGLRDQFAAELFYRLQVSPDIQCTVGYQAIVDPSNDPGSDLVGVFETRLRIAF